MEREGGRRRGREGEEGGEGGLKKGREKRTEGVGREG